MRATEDAHAVEVFQRVPATPDVVFAYFTDSDMYRQWKGLDAELDARPGGVYRVKMWDGGAIEGTYVVVDPPRSVVFTWGWQGHPLPKGFIEVPPASSTVEVTFTPDGDGTIIRLRHSGLPTDDAESAHRWGWTTYFPRLETILAGGDPGPDPASARAAKYLAGR